MDTQSEMHPQHPSEARAAPRFITPEELFRKSRVTFAPQIRAGEFSETELRTFIQDRVEAVRINGVDVVSLDFEHGDKDIHPISRAFMDAEATRAVVIEYFYPELRQNAANSGLLKNLEGHLTPKGKPDLYEKKIIFSERISRHCKDIQKPVVAIDIANKASYMLVRQLFRMLPTITALGIMGSDFQLQHVPSIAAGTVAQVAIWLQIYRKDKIPAIDKFILDYEQARRLYLAKGVEQLTHEYPPLPQDGKPESQIVVVYPKAHGMRMADILVNPHPHLDKFKDAVYKPFGPTLDFSVRTWQWKDSLQRLKRSGYRWGTFSGQEKENDSTSIPVDDDSLEGWRLVSDRKIQV